MNLYNVQSGALMVPLAAQGSPSAPAETRKQGWFTKQRKAVVKQTVVLTVSHIADRGLTEQDSLVKAISKNLAGGMATFLPAFLLPLLKPVLYWLVSITVQYVFNRILEYLESLTEDPEFVSYSKGLKPTPETVAAELLRGS